MILPPLRPRRSPAFILSMVMLSLLGLYIAINVLGGLGSEGY